MKDKEILLKIAREKPLATYKGTSKGPSADFLTEILQARRCCIIYSK